MIIDENNILNPFKLQEKKYYKITNKMIELLKS